MLTRLRISGFKNLVDVDVRFGPFTCIAGANGVGKSNLFDAIRFLSALADQSLMEAALSVRDEGKRSGDIRELFHRIGDYCAQEMTFEAEMLIPEHGQDDLGQRATATSTFLRYTLSLGYKAGKGIRSLEILKEDLSPIKVSEVPRSLPFAKNVKLWRESVVRRKGPRYVPFISTTITEDESHIINRHQDGGSRGNPLKLPANSLPRTVLSSSNAAESPTALLARNEMRSWRLIQLEPSSLREPDYLTSPQHLGIDGANLPATLHRLAHIDASNEVYTSIANRLAELLNDIRSIDVDIDEGRQLLTLKVETIDGTIHPGRALSDGTLRFLALATIEIDPSEDGLLCLEEPENGIHPARIPAILRLLNDIAVDTSEPISSSNPLRQVIINTHSPSVVAQVSDSDLVVAELREKADRNRRFKRVVFSCLSDTWRAKAEPKMSILARGELLAYLNPNIYALDEEFSDVINGAQRQIRSNSNRIMDRDDLQMMFQFNPSANA